MKRNAEFHDYVVFDLMGHIPGITSRPMFGGWGIYKDGVVFAIITGGTLYFKVDDTNRAQFVEYGSEPFRFESRGKEVTLSYFELPEEIMNDRERLSEWVERSTRISRISRKNARERRRGRS